MNAIDYALPIIKQFSVYNPNNLPEEDAERLLMLDLQDALSDAEDLVSDASWRNCVGSEIPHAALISLAHSMGTVAFCKCDVCKLILEHAKPRLVQAAWLRMPAANPDLECDLPARRRAEADLYEGRVRWYLDKERRPVNISNLTTATLLVNGLPAITHPKKPKK